MTPFLYLIILLVTLVCMVLCDFRWRLTFFHDPKRATLVSIVMLVAFLLWDAAGIATVSYLAVKFVREKISETRDVRIVDQFCQDKCVGCPRVCEASLNGPFRAA